MTPPVATLLLSIVLAVISAWAYLGSDSPSTTALIPLGFGILLSLCALGARRNKIVPYVAVVLVAVLVLALSMPLKGAVGRGDVVAIVRVSVMWVASMGTLVIYIRSFIRARRAAAETVVTDTE